MRVYLPTTLTDLAGILKSGELGPAPLRGYAVTPALREAYASGDEEELEYVAMLAAARESLRMIARSPGGPRRRVVLAADVPDAGATFLAYDDEPAAVTVTAEIPLSAVASGHVDDEAAVADVTAAALASAAADGGDEDAQFTVDGADGHELGWYATQELAHLDLGQALPGELVCPLWMLLRRCRRRTTSRFASTSRGAPIAPPWRPGSRTCPASGPS